MAHTPTQIKHTLRLPLGVLVDDVWQELGLVEIPVTLHVDVRGGRTLAATNIARRENFREAVADLERAANRGFELGT